MKKILLSLAFVATVACFASCAKNCTCTVYVDGLSTEEEFSLDELNEKYNLDLKKCSDMNTVEEVMGVTMGTSCK